ncbi:exonuclease mut-7 homolog [Brevipalpus obovatus]|uniref:exonuclease mut-7 homolog n=1 Tax=Brevipalpus obovatus TaxID=246614 RepID=UPI003D9EE01C
MASSVDIIDFSHYLRSFMGASYNLSTNPQLTETIKGFINNRRKEFLFSDMFLLMKSLDGSSIRSIPTKSVGFAVLSVFHDYLKGDGDKLTCDQATSLASLDFAVILHHQLWIEKICDVFQISSAPRDLVVRKIRDLIDKHDYTTAAWIVKALGFHDSFSIYDIALPLVAQDKVNVLESYMEGSPRVTREVIQFLDSCSRSISGLDEIITRVPGVKTEKIHPKIFTKLVKRLIKIFNVDSSVCPNVSLHSGIGTLRFLVSRKYISNTLDDDTWHETVKQTVKDERKLQIELLNLLCEVSAVSEAKKWSDLFSIPEDQLPYPLQVYDEASNTASNSTSNGWDNLWDDEPSSAKSVPELPDLEMHLGEEDIKFINDEKEFIAMIDEIVEYYTLVSYDSEWKPMICPLSKNVVKVALIQIATWDNIFLLDVLALRESNIWKRFMHEIIDNANLMILGYGIAGDFKNLRTTFPDLKFEPKNVIDIGPLSDMILEQVKIPVCKTPDDCKGLAKLTALVLGKKLQKAQQFSNWEARPLRPEQIKYAALDVYSVLKIYEKLYELCSSKSLDFAKILDSFTGKTIRSQPLVLDQMELDPNDSIQFPKLPVREFKCVVDTMLNGLGVKLRLIGADVHILPNNFKHESAAIIAKKENRKILSSGKAYERLKNLVPPGHCFNVMSLGSTENQMMRVIKRYNLIVKESDLLSRCTKCNCEKFISADHQTMLHWLKENRTLPSGCPINYGLLQAAKNKSPTSEFFICSSCGYIYWDGSHLSSLKTHFGLILTT